MLTEHKVKMNNVKVSAQGSALLYTGLRSIACTISLLVLAGCANDSGTRAPVNDLNQAASTGAGVAKSYTVKPGDTLNKIMRSTGVDESTIKRLNKLSDPNRLIVGQVLKLSDGTEPVSTRPAAIAPNSKSEARPLDQASSGPATDTAPSRATDAGVINWGWPAQGKVIQGFTSNTKGIDISGSAGDSIVAAANGQVMYSGNGVRGLGNLVIIDHKDGFITAYAHNRSLLVKKDQIVKKGAKIAEMGQTDAASVRLHFEVRRQGTPVDPLQYLPAK
jgi:lipoprotein NlpD